MFGLLFYFSLIYFTLITTEKVEPIEISNCGRWMQRKTFSTCTSLIESVNLRVFFSSKPNAQTHIRMRNWMNHFSSVLSNFQHSCHGHLWEKNSSINQYFGRCYLATSRNSPRSFVLFHNLKYDVETKE